MLSQFQERVQERTLLKVRGRQRTDSTHVLSLVRGLHRLETLVESVRFALNSLAEADPEWLRTWAGPEWIDRYGRRADNYRLPRPQEQREKFAQAVGADGVALLGALWSADAPPSLRRLPAVEALRRVWLQQFHRQPDQGQGEQVCLRGEADLPPGALRIVSPYDLEARFSVKRQTRRTGYKVHLTETCDADAPHLITQVLTTPSTTADSEATPRIQEALARASRLPSEHLVGEGYTQASHLVSSRARHGVEIVGPVARDGSRQAAEGKGLDVSQFRLDCPRRSDCTRSKGRGRTL